MINIDCNIIKDNDFINYLYETINSITIYFELEVDIKVNIVDYLKEEDIAVMYYDNRYNIDINKDVYNIYKDYPILIETYLFHEVTHIYDLYNIKQCFNINLSKFKWEKEEDLFINLGYFFWTEFNTYLTTFKIYKDYIDYETKLEIIKQIKTTTKKEKKMSKTSNLNDKEILDFYYDIYKIVYLVAKNFAGQITGKRKYYKYNDKTVNSKEYKYLAKTYKYLSKSLIKIINDGIYNKKLKTKLFKLGKIIYKRFYNYFNIYTKEDNNYIFLAYYSDVE